MPNWTRRDLLRTGLGIAAATVLPPPLANALERTAPAAEPPPPLELLPAAASPRQRLLLDADWKFHLGDADDPAHDFGFGSNDAFAKVGGDLFPGMSRRKFDDADWRSVTLPHDWAVELPFVDETRLLGHGYKPLGREHPATSIGWYRRTFDLSADDANRRISLEFDGVYRNAMVTLNGHYLGRNLSGYAPFAFDVSTVANFGAPNVLVVRVDATENEGWFYEGAGIYRHVWLVKTHPMHVPQWGVFVRSEVPARNGKAANAALIIATEIANDSAASAECRVISEIRDPSGHVVANAHSASTSVEPGAQASVEQRATVAAPALWSLEAPRLYTLVTSIISNSGALLDRCESPFGIRDIRFDPNEGFFLN
ncbi:MAG TPA: beta-galactosidase, partial [Gemmatimonadaceae bacterium]|nr:beta-galactosidase [Gemmatimonadaceae bacterium]